MAVTDGRRDSGISTGGIKRSLRSPTARLVLTILCALLVIGFMGVLYTMYREQDRKLDELEAEKALLEDRLDELSREKERLEGKLEYTNSLEGLLQYARDNLGYVFPDDTRLDDGTEGGNGN